MFQRLAQGIAPLEHAPRLHELPAAQLAAFIGILQCGLHRFLVACARNWRVFLVYAGATLLFGAILPGVVVGMLSLMFSDVSKVFSVMFTTLIVLVILPTLYASFYVSYREVFVFDDEND